MKEMIHFLRRFFWDIPKKRVRLQTMYRESDRDACQDWPTFRKHKLPLVTTWEECGLLGLHINIPRLTRKHGLFLRRLLSLIQPLHPSLTEIWFYLQRQTGCFLAGLFMNSRSRANKPREHRGVCSLRSGCLRSATKTSCYSTLKQTNTTGVVLPAQAAGFALKPNEQFKQMQPNGEDFFRATGKPSLTFST